MFNTNVLFLFIIACVPIAIGVDPQPSPQPNAWQSGAPKPWQSPNWQTTGSPAAQHQPAGNSQTRGTSQNAANRAQQNRHQSNHRIQHTQSKAQVTDSELTALSESLFEQDVNNAGSKIQVHLQNLTRSNSLVDEASNPLLTINSEVLNGDTIKPLRNLYDNYIADTSFVESVTKAEQNEEDEFLSKVLETSVMKSAMDFLASKGVVQKNPTAYKNFLKSLWFTIYSRGGRILGSSAFEHVFLGEVKKDEVSGLHNWVFFSNEEDNRHADYMGYLRKLELGKDSYLLKIHYRWAGILKYSGTLFVGTSPELEMALYTVCFYTRPDERCPMSLGGKSFGIQTYSFRSKGKNLIGSAYPLF